MKTFVEWCKTPLGKIVCFVLIAVLLVPVIFALLGTISVPQFINIAFIYVVAIGLAVLSPLYIAAIVMGIVYFGKAILIVWDIIKWCYKLLCKRS